MGWMQRPHLTDELYRVLQRPRKFCTSPKGALETEGNTSPFRLSCPPVSAALKGSSVPNQPYVTH